MCNIANMFHVIAYIDPGSGSIIIQATIAAVAGATIVIKLYWDRLLKFLGIRKSNKTNPLINTGEKTTIDDHQ